MMPDITGFVFGYSLPRISLSRSRASAGGSLTIEPISVYSRLASYIEFGLSTKLYLRGGRPLQDPNGAGSLSRR
jgi:hypothetical protein